MSLVYQSNFLKSLELRRTETTTYQRILGSRFRSRLTTCSWSRTGPPAPAGGRTAPCSRGAAAGGRRGSSPGGSAPTRCGGRSPPTPAGRLSLCGRLTGLRLRLRLTLRRRFGLTLSWGRRLTRRLLTLILSSWGLLCGGLTGGRFGLSCLTLRLAGRFRLPLLGSGGLRLTLLLLLLWSRLRLVLCCRWRLLLLWRRFGRLWRRRRLRRGLWRRFLCRRCRPAVNGLRERGRHLRDRRLGGDRAVGRGRLCGVLGGCVRGSGGAAAPPPPSASTAPSSCNKLGYKHKQEILY